MLVPRSDFRKAIAGGIARAGGLLTEENVAALKRVTEEATAFAGNFADPSRSGLLHVGCPASQANLDRSDGGAAWQFACGFDDTIGPILDATYGWHAYANNFHFTVQG